MITAIQMTVPRCTECSSMMMKSPSPDGNEMYYICYDCNKVLRVIGRGKLDGEVLVSDNLNDVLEDDDANLF